MSQLLNKLITRLKGNAYQIDPQIPASYLLSLMASRGIMLIRGAFSRIKHQGYLFIGKNVTLKARSKITMGRSVTIGHHCYIDALSTEGIILGDNVSLGKNVSIECTGNLQFIGKGLKVGNNVGLGANNFFGCAGGIEIGDDTILGNFISFHAENHVYSDINISIRLQPVTRKGIVVGKNCWIGARVTILDGAIIEDNCIIAAGAVIVAGKYVSGGIYGGIPAKLIKFRDN